jgi:DNA-binding Lrp family transcriptional regulator
MRTLLKNEQLVYDALKTPQIMTDVKRLTNMSLSTCSQTIHRLEKEHILKKSGKKWERIELNEIEKRDLRLRLLEDKREVESLLGGYQLRLQRINKMLEEINGVEK